MQSPSPIYKVKAVAPVTFTNASGNTTLTMQTGDTATLRKVIGVDPVATGNQVKTLIQIKTETQSIYVYIYGTSIPAAIKKQGELALIGVIDNKTGTYSSADGDPEKFELEREIKRLKLICGFTLVMSFVISFSVFTTQLKVDSVLRKL